MKKLRKVVFVTQEGKKVSFFVAGKKRRRVTKAHRKFDEY